MSVSDFKAEFSQFLLRFSFGENKTPDVPPRLTNQKILDAIHDVLRATLNVNLQNIEATALKTPANKIVISMPQAPDIPCVDYSQNNRLKSRLSLGSANDDDFSKSNFASFLKVSGENNDSPVSDDSISKSEHSTNKDFENINSIFDAVKTAEDIFAQVQKALDERFKSRTSKMNFKRDSTMCNIVDGAHKKITKVAYILEHLKELLMPESYPVRRLSAIVSCLPIKQQQSAQTQHKSSAAPNLERYSDLSGDIEALAAVKGVRGSYWHGTPSAVRLLNVYHFVYLHYGYYFRPSNEDLVFFEWMAATNRLYSWLTWRTTNIAARSIGIPDLVSCPLDISVIPPEFDYYFRDNRLGFLRTDQDFYRMKFNKNVNDRFVKFCFALYRAKAASLLAQEWELEDSMEDGPITPISLMSLVPQPSSTAAATAKKLVTPKTAQSKARSESEPILAEPHKSSTSTGQPAESQLKINPKYAHARGTIPKLTSSSINPKT